MNWEIHDCMENRKPWLKVLFRLDQQARKETDMLYYAVINGSQLYAQNR